MSALARMKVTEPPLASPMSWDPHSNETASVENPAGFPFVAAALASQLSQTRIISSSPGDDLFLGLDLSTQVGGMAAYWNQRETEEFSCAGIQSRLPHKSAGRRTRAHGQV